MSREIHSADGSSYIEQVGRTHTRWTVFHQGRQIGAYRTREEAREAIHEAKGLPRREDPFDRLVRKLNEFRTLTKEQFERLCQREKIEPDSDRLVSALVDQGWTFNFGDDEPTLDPAAGRWKHITEGWLDEMPVKPRIRPPFAVRENPKAP